MEAFPGKTSKEDQRIAKLSIATIRAASQKVINNDRNFVKIKLQEEGDFLKIPKKALLLLFNILSNMAQGKSVTLIPSGVEVSTQQAADILNVSRPHLVKLLEEGQIQFKKAGSHRRIELKNLLEYEKKLKENRKEKLNFLTKQAQELKLGY